MPLADEEKVATGSKDQWWLSCTSFSSVRQNVSCSISCKILSHFPLILGKIRSLWVIVCIISCKLHSTVKIQTTLFLYMFCVLNYKLCAITGVLKESGKQVTPFVSCMPMNKTVRICIRISIIWGIHGLRLKCALFNQTVRSSLKRGTKYSVGSISS